MTTQAKTQKISNGHYLYKGLHIVRFDGDSETTWNIWENIELTKEWDFGYYSKKDALQAIDNYYENAS